jgi:glycosyltransferase involved in cell wall biosynthesis
MTSLTPSRRSLEVMNTPGQGMATPSSVQTKDGDHRPTIAEDSERDLDILILGPVPPPFGGIAVHVDRLVPLLQESGLRVGVLNHFRSADPEFVLGTLNRNPIKYFRKPRRFPAKLVHYHHSRWCHLVATALGKRPGKTRYIVTLHAGDIQKQFPHLTSRLPLVRRITRWALRRFDAVIAVDPEVASILQSHLKEKRIEVFPAFLDARAEDFARYEPAVEEFLESGRVLLVAAYGIQFLQRGGELYGVDTAVEAFIDLARQHEELRLVIFVARHPTRVKARRHLAHLESQLERAGLKDRVLILFGLPLVPAFRKNTIYVRPTRAEGDAVSIREAQRAGVPVIASDVVPRPDGVDIFPVANAALLAAAVRLLLQSGVEVASESGQRGETLIGPGFVRELIRFYESELAEVDRFKRAG